MKNSNFWLLAGLPLLFAACAPADEGAVEELADTAAVTPAPTPGAMMDTMTAGQATVAIAQNASLGAYLVDADGRSLYLFLADSPGISTCYDACAEAWPPYLAPQGTTMVGDPAVQADLLGTLERRDGGTQVTYGGWPLYYYVEDQGPGEITGQDIEDFGAEWYLVSPQGEQVEEAGE